MEVRCPHCGQRNRLPVDRISQGPSCGKCRRPLLDEPLAADEPTLADLIAQPHLPVLVDFWAPWCGPCRGFAPTFKAAAGRFAGQAIFAKVDTEAQPGIGQQFNIRAIPTLVTFAGGRESGRVSGALPAGELDKLVRRII